MWVMCIYCAIQLAKKVGNLCFFLKKSVPQNTGFSPKQCIFKYPIALSVENFVFESIAQASHYSSVIVNDCNYK